MLPSPCLKWLRSPLVALGLLLAVALTCQGESGIAGPTCLDDLARLGPCELQCLFTQAEIGHPLVGTARGRLLYLTDKMPRIKVRMANSVWRGKTADEDGSFSNRWVGGINWIDSHYVVGPSWVDGKPAIIMEYPAGTRLFWNMHDELREVAPGLYMGPVYERFPCPKLRGYVALQLESCQGCRR
jgi:hypothetical protein